MPRVKKRFWRVGRIAPGLAPRRIDLVFVVRSRTPKELSYTLGRYRSLPAEGSSMKRNKVQDLRVSDFMSTDLVTASPDETLGDVLGKMKSNDIHELPVIERKKLAGVVTMRELMRRRNLPPTTKVST